MKKFLILQLRPENETADSEFKAILRVGGLKRNEVHRIRLEEGIPNIDINDYSAIIAGGSPFDICTKRENKSKVQKDIEAFFVDLFDRIVPADFPFLGACSGNGHLGQYCGATISNKYPEPIGSVDVTLTEEGSKDPLLKGLPKEFLALAGHKEACDEIPPHSVLLVTSKPCPVQMFRVKSNIYATQFHPEADANEFIVRIHTYKNYGYFPPEEAEGLIKSLRNIKAPIPNEILKRFVARYRLT